MGEDEENTDQEEHLALSSVGWQDEGDREHGRRRRDVRDVS